MLNKCTSAPQVTIPQDESFVINTTTRTSRRKMIHQNVGTTTTTTIRRRARSMSPIRRSSRIVHTNGRLDQPVLLMEDDTSSFMMPMPKKDMRRTVSCDQASSKRKTTKTCSPRMRIYYSNETLRKRCEENQERLFQFAQKTSCSITNTTPSSSSNHSNTMLAIKALKYRKIFDKLKEADVTDPSFDVSKCLGVSWCKRA
jgi:hypothetical protein